MKFAAAVAPADVGGSCGHSGALAALGPSFRWGDDWFRWGDDMSVAAAAVASAT